MMFLESIHLSLLIPYLLTGKAITDTDLKVTIQTINPLGSKREYLEH